MRDTNVQHGGHKTVIAAADNQTMNSAAKLFLMVFSGTALLTTPGSATSRSTEQPQIRPMPMQSASALMMNGSGWRRMLGIKVYEAALYLPQPARTTAQALAPNTPRRLDITLLRHTVAEQHIDALREGLDDNTTPAERAAIESEQAQFMTLIGTITDIPAGTKISLTYAPGQGTLIYFDGHLLGIVPGEAFNRALMKIWLGDHPIQTSLKRALLGQS